MPHVDVAIPTHGESRWLAESVASVLGQSHADLTLRVSENGPGGGAAGGILAAFAGDPRVRHAVTGGVPIEANWNRCFAAGDGDYVAVLPHDETWDPGWLETRVRFLEEHPECALVFSSAREIDADGALLGLPRFRLAEGVHGPHTTMPVFLRANPVPCCAVLARRSAVEELGPEPMVGHLKMGMDWMMWMRIAARHPVGYLHLRDNCGRLHATSQTAAHTGWGAMHLHVLAYAERIAADALPADALPRALMAERRSEAHVLCACDALDAGDVEAAREHLRVARRLRPRALATTRGAGAHAAAWTGAAGRRALRGARDAEARLQLRLKLSRRAVQVAPSLSAWLPFY